MIASTGCGRKATDMKGVQIFVDYGQWSTAVRSFSHDVLSDVLRLHADDCSVVLV